MIIGLNFKSGLPVYLQLVEQVKSAVASGALRAGEPVPSIRPLAEELRINRNTVAKAYAELERQGVIETIMGKGCFVARNSCPLKKEIREGMLAEAVDAAIVQAHHLQFSESEFLALAKDRLEKFQLRNGSQGEKG